ncbi:MAG: chemotaxis protein CheA [candidate division Zixibacteria bacterium]|nr:chemotaxis protein CheA [candidate division Zixibacteria bacterium]
MQEIIDEFMIETTEIVESLDSDLIKLEKDPHDLELLNSIFRGAHTMKGTSGFLGYDHLMNLTHRMEDVLNKLRKNELQVTEKVMDVLLEAVDYVKLVLQDIIDNQQGNTDTSGIISKLTAIYNSEPLPESKPQAADSASVEVEETKGETAAETTEIKAETAASDKPKESPRTEAAVSSSAPPKKSASNVIESTIRVGVDRLDSLVNMVGELVLHRNALIQTTNILQGAHEADQNVERLVQAASDISFMTTELHVAIMKMRMLQIGHVFNKFPRIVRDLSRELSKKMDLEISGEDTELDKSVIEEINDPLMHLIRNSADHGIELPEDRVNAGKPERGTIELSACQEGNNIVIKVGDDGKGMNLESIKKKIIEKGLASPEAVEQMAQKEILSYIFQPGLSTARTTTLVSGRGVGMDVVRTNIEKLKGTIELSSEEGKGSLVTIRLPLTLAIVQGLLVKCGKDVFAVPLASVIETVIVPIGQVKYINQKPVIKLRDSILPIVELTHVLFNISPENRDNLRIVVVGLAEKRMGLIVDSLVGQEEIVIKSMGDYLGETPGVAGATIMGDGRVRLIIDLASLFELV